MKESNKLILGNLHLRKKEYAKLLKVDQIIFVASKYLLSLASKIIYSLLSLIITYLLFDTEFTSITPGLPIRIIFHFLELILKNSLFLIKDLKLHILEH